VRFLRLFREVDITRCPRTAITERVQERVLNVFNKYAGEFSRSRAACDMLGFALHVLQQLCYRNWEPSQSDQAPPTQAPPEPLPTPGGDCRPCVGGTGGTYSPHALPWLLS
jgi:hypothetical protein